MWLSLRGVHNFISLGAPKGYNLALHIVIGKYNYHKIMATATPGTKGGNHVFYLLLHLRKSFKVMEIIFWHFLNFICLCYNIIEQFYMSYLHIYYLTIHRIHVTEYLQWKTEFCTFIQVKYGKQNSALSFKLNTTQYYHKKKRQS